MNEKLKKIFSYIGAFFAAVGLFLFGYLAKTKRNDRQRNIDGIDTELRKQEDIARQEGSLTKRERDNLDRERAITEAERNILSRDEQLLAELKKRQQE